MIRRISSLAFFVSLVGAVVPGCERTEPQFAGATEAIVPGTADDHAPVLFPEVVNIDSECTGTLISPSHVLTAGHCAVEITPREVVVHVDTPDLAGSSFAVAGCFVNPAFTSLLRSRGAAVRPGVDLTAKPDQCGALN